MLRDATICYGCCLDLQSLARAKDFDSDPFRDLLDSLSQRTSRPVLELRKTCLEHQQELISVQLEASSSAEERTALLELASIVSTAALQAR